MGAVVAQEPVESGPLEIVDARHVHENEPLDALSAGRVGQAAVVGGKVAGKIGAEQRLQVDRRRKVHRRVDRGLVGPWYGGGRVLEGQVQERVVVATARVPLHDNGEDAKLPCKHRAPCQ